MKVMLAKHLKRSISEVEFKKNAYGKPYLEGDPLHFNISHSGKWVVGVISNEAVGIDVEEIKQADLGIAERFFARGEYEILMKVENVRERNQAFYMLWSGKESYIKMIGKGLTIPLEAFSLSYAGGELRLKQPYESAAAEFTVYPLEEGTYSCVICHGKNISNIAYEKVDSKMLYSILKGSSCFDNPMKRD